MVLQTTSGIYASACPTSTRSGWSRLLCGILLLGLTMPLHAMYVRATCKGIVDFSDSAIRARCHEANLLTDPEGGLVSGFTTAAVDVATGALNAGAAGGQIRDVGYNGGEASAFFKDRLTILGDWQGAIPVTVSMLRMSSRRSNMREISGVIEYRSLRREPSTWLSNCAAGPWTAMPLPSDLVLRSAGIPYK